MIQTTDPTWVYVTTLIIPILVALLKARYSTSQVGALILVVLITLQSLIVEFAVYDEFAFKTFLMRMLFTGTVAVAAHYGMWKPLKITGNEGAVLIAAPQGIGKPGVATS